MIKYTEFCKKSIFTAFFNFNFKNIGIFFLDQKKYNFKNMKLSKRLEKIISLIKLNERIIDIGTDHAFVPIEIYNRDISRSITAT